MNIYGLFVFYGEDIAKVFECDIILCVMGGNTVKVVNWNIEAMELFDIEIILNNQNVKPFLEFVVVKSFLINRYKNRDK